MKRGARAPLFVFYNKLQKKVLVFHWVPNNYTTQHTKPIV